MRISWPLVIALLIVAVVVGLLLNQFEFAALLLATTILIVVLVVVSHLISRSGVIDWHIFASSDSRMEGLTLDDVYPPEAAKMFKDHFSQEHPGILVMGVNAEGKWQKYDVDENGNSGNSNPEDE